MGNEIGTGLVITVGCSLQSIESTFLESQKSAITLSKYGESYW